MSFRPIHVAGAVLAVTLGATQASASVVETFSFETPSLGAGVYYYNPAGTPGVTYNGISGPTGGGGSGIAANGSAFGFPNAPDGAQVAFIQNANNTVGQITLSLSGLTAGASYDATFYTAARPGYPVDPLIVDFDSTVVGSSAGTSRRSSRRQAAEFATAPCAWPRVAPLLPSPTLRVEAAASPGRDRKAGMPIKPESGPLLVDTTMRLREHSGEAMHHPLGSIPG